MQHTTLIKSISKKLFLISFFISVFGCASISQFDQYAYVQTTSLKVDALELMELAVEDYEKHAEKVMKLKSDIQKVYEYEKNRPKNEITVKMWEKLMNENGHLLGGFLLKWEQQGKQSEVFIRESKKIIGPAFDQIAQLESKKIKPSDI